MRNPHVTTLRGLGALPRILKAEGGKKLLGRVLRSSNLSEAALENLDHKVPLSFVLNAFQFAERFLPDPSLGIRIGHEMSPQEFGLWAKYVTSALSLEGMFRRSQRAIGLHQTGSILKATKKGHLLKWSYHLIDLPPNRLHIDHALIPMLGAVRAYAGMNWNPLRVEVQYNSGPWRRYMEDYFQCDVFFGRPTNALLMPANFIANRRQSISKSAKDVSLAELRDLAAKRPAANYTETTHAAIYLKLLEGSHDIEDVARSLGTSVRKLQRDLNGEGVNFRLLRDAVRLEECTRLMKYFDIQIGELAQELGYSDQAHFTRAFRRWTGHSPSEYQRCINKV